MTHICVGKLITIGSDNGLSSGRRQAIIWTNAGLLSIGPLRTYFSENLIKILQFSLKKMHVKMSSAKWRPSCLGLNVLKGSPPGSSNEERVSVAWRHHVICHASIDIDRQTLTDLCLRHLWYGYSSKSRQRLIYSTILLHYYMVSLQPCCRIIQKTTYNWIAWLLC